MHRVTGRIDVVISTAIAAVGKSATALACHTRQTNAAANKQRIYF